MSETLLSNAVSPGFERLVLFDGVCGFCDAAVQWVIERDPDGRLHFAPLQGETARRLRERHPEIPDGVDSLVYVEMFNGSERVHLRSAAIVAVCRALPRPPFWGGVLAALPEFVADFLYSVFARARYRLFGKRDACRVPSPEERRRFLA